MRNASPRLLYVLGTLSFILSRIFIGRVDVLNYAFALIGAVLMFVAIRKYIQKRKK
jgi:positive regulator of sigma E activity